ncbi:MAG: hypothetical protein H0Z18_10845 [Thermococcus sp.]|uniref:hypothetical protein n=1 Tax=Thermococcus sp. TaxID=35749 RepID=UPI001DF86096|nr:hypothetical protein [Thermococcus sp.]MBO8175743.1 hypothetical protein [Thermococcus sp.]
MFEKLIVISFIGAMVWYIVELLLWPWKHSQNRIRELEKAISNVKKGGLRAKLMVWLNAPKLRGNIQLYQKLLEVELEAEKRKYEIYSSLRRDKHV